jgi:hypothetical protein
MPIVASGRAAEAARPLVAQFPLTVSEAGSTGCFSSSMFMRIHLPSVGKADIQ